jgi:hypothetical protein
MKFVRTIVVEEYIIYIYIGRELYLSEAAHIIYSGKHQIMQALICLDINNKLVYFVKKEKNSKFTYIYAA